MSDSRLSKMPKWVQTYVADLERQRDTAVQELKDWADHQTPQPLKDWADHQTPQPLSIRELDTSTNPPRMITRYIAGYTLLAKWRGVCVDIVLEERGIGIRYGRDGGSLTDRVFFTPVAHQQFELQAPEEKQA